VNRADGVKSAKGGVSAKEGLFAHAPVLGLCFFVSVQRDEEGVKSAEEGVKSAPGDTGGRQPALSKSSRENTIRVAPEGPPTSAVAGRGGDTGPTERRSLPAGALPDTKGGLSGPRPAPVGGARVSTPRFPPGGPVPPPPPVLPSMVFRVNLESPAVLLATEAPLALCPLVGRLSGVGAL